MNEFEPQPAEIAPVTPTAPPPPKKESLLTRKIWLGQSLPWLAVGALLIAAAGWYLLWPSSSVPDAGELAFGQPAGLSAVQQAPATVPAPAAPVPLQTGGLSVPDGTLSGASAAGSVPEEVVKLIREGRDFEAANREAITRLSDTVRAQTRALATLQQQMDNITQENSRLANQLAVLAARPAEPAGQAAGARRTTRSAIAGMRLESLQDGMAWISWQGRTYAVQSGDSLGGLIVRDVNVSDRSVTTSAGVLR
ncbi:conjugal transfer protein TraP [Pantoea septica]|uniref:conjugal transfer protein TraP n=1 Tax=Pantoea sp. GABEPS69 TaxID=3028805 RepID=UPI0023F3F9B4|nr:conjugal transfer protein TraP [Pantoea septica]